MPVRHTNVVRIDSLPLGRCRPRSGCDALALDQRRLVDKDHVRPIRDRDRALGPRHRVAFAEPARLLDGQRLQPDCARRRIGRGRRRYELASARLSRARRQEQTNESRRFHRLTPCAFGLTSSGWRRLVLWSSGDRTGRRLGCGRGWGARRGRTGGGAGL